MEPSHTILIEFWISHYTTKDVFELAVFMNAVKPNQKTTIFVIKSRYKKENAITV